MRAQTNSATTSKFTSSAPSEQPKSSTTTKHGSADSEGQTIPPTKTNNFASAPSEQSTFVATPTFRTADSEGQTTCASVPICPTSAPSEQPIPNPTTKRQAADSEGVGDQTIDVTEATNPSSNADALLLFYADLLDDAEKLRLATENRRRSLLSTEDWGKGVHPFLPEVSVVENLLAQVEGIEKGATRSLQMAMRAHPLGAWVKGTQGVGEKQGARLLAAIGDPAWNSLHNRPRTWNELWAYCGLHVLHPDQVRNDSHGHIVGVEDGFVGDHEPVGNNHDARVADSNGAKAVGSQERIATQVANGTHGLAPRRTRGQKANWSSTARSRVYVIAISCMKNTKSPYRAVYDEGREKYSTAVHHHVCRNTKRPPMGSNGCGTTANPEWGAVGSLLRPGHQHARALRLVMKAILKDLWIEANRAE